jgi:SHS2 domain-containing protein
MIMSYYFLDHVADVKFQAKGNSLEEMFLSASQALFEVMRGKIEILDQERIKLQVKSSSMEGLIHNFLEEFLFLLDAKGFLVSKLEDIKVDPENFSIECTAVGDKEENYSFTNDVKAVTYSELSFKQNDREFSCQIVLDV